MTRKYKWTIEIEIDAVEVEKHLTDGYGLAFNDATAYDMVADGLLPESAGNTFQVCSVKLQRPDVSPITFALQYGDGPKLAAVK